MLKRSLPAYQPILLSRILIVPQYCAPLALQSTELFFGYACISTGQVLTEACIRGGWETSL